MSTYYEILGVDPLADDKTIRQAYLKQSLKHHPDKNPEQDKEAAKARFCAIGEAYEVLSNPTERAMYDQSLRRGRPSTYYGTTTSSTTQAHYQQSYENYQDVFDSTVASMSEAELAAAVGAIGVVAGVIGSIVGSRLAAGALGGSSHTSRGTSSSAAAASSFLSSAGSMVGSMVASHAAIEAAKVLHHQAVERIAYKEEVKRCQARGCPVPPPPSQSKMRWDETFQRVAASMKNSVTGNSTSTSATESSFRSSSTPMSDRDSTPAWQNMLQKAAQELKKATAAAASAPPHRR